MFATYTLRIYAKTIHYKTAHCKNGHERQMTCHRASAPEYIPIHIFMLSGWHDLVDMRFRPVQNGWQFPDGSCHYIFFTENDCILIHISLDLGFNWQYVNHGSDNVITPRKWRTIIRTIVAFNFCGLCVWDIDNFYLLSFLLACTHLIRNLDPPTRILLLPPCVVLLLKKIT